MSRLQRELPRVAHWRTDPMFRFADNADLSLWQIHALMLELRCGVGQLLIERRSDGSVRRYFSDVEWEVKEMVREGGAHGIGGLTALLREAELRQDPLAHLSAYEALIDLIPCLNEDPATRRIAPAFARYLGQRFLVMRRIFEGCYRSDPRTAAFTLSSDVTERTDDPDEFERALRDDAEFWYPALPVTFRLG